MASQDKPYAPLTPESTISDSNSDGTEDCNIEGDDNDADDVEVDNDSDDSYDEDCNKDDSEVGNHNDHNDINE